ncbi:hypothetical protein [Croceivirga thetidis]|uniref:Uncharacterized protein n=1 Tax=Croceivirga thetidis TaxID=2721623 RepID=A0ABX1GWM1_9FLAO|nr:hypothetical protein [Croceivirga thetidis]NKI33355.1 hypothetical protein [Croceivirga thetidis]
MIRLFLKAKHWQLFVLMIGIPLLYQLYFLFQIWGYKLNPEPVANENGFSEVLNERFLQLDLMFPVLMIFFSLLFFGWFWSIAIGLQPKIPPQVKMKVKKFKVFFFIPFLYIIFLMMYLGGLFSGLGTNGFGNGFWIISIMLPLHFLSMFCIFYSLYFVAKTIKTAELQREVNFGDFAGEFFLLWFYFVGIWIIQPKVNKLYAA